MPSSPSNLRLVDASDGIISIAWAPPKSDGGSPVTGYTVETCRSGGTGWTKAANVNAATTTADLKDLADGSYYFVRVFAENQVGLSKRAAEFLEAVHVQKTQSTLTVLDCCVLC